MRRFLTLTTLLVVLAISAVAMAIWGWSAEAGALGLSVSDIFYRSLGAISLLYFYEDSATFNGDWRIEVARWLGAATFAVIGAKAVMALLSRQVAEFGGRFRRGHLMIIGDHPVARSMAEAAGMARFKTTWITDSAAAEAPVTGVLVVQRRWNRENANLFGAPHARKCLVSFNDEARLIAAVRDLRLVSLTVPVVMNCPDPWFAERMDELENISGVRIVSEAQLALRSLHWMHPPFLIARNLGHERIHAVMLGFGRGGEAALSDLLLSSLTTFLGRPRVTIFDPRAAEIRASLTMRCPDLTGSVDIDVIDPGFRYDSRIVPREALEVVHDQCPITVAYVCLDTDQRSLAAAISLQALFRREGWTTGPIFTRVSARGALPDQGSVREAGQSAGLVSFGSMYDFAAGIGLFETDPDGLPRRFHEAYRRAAPNHAAANLPWEALSEEHRESNRRLVTHLPAKLASAGFDLEGWLVDHPSLAANGRRLDAPDFAADADLLERLAILEHDRWMMERRLGGWRPGAARDNLRRIHPDLKPYDMLTEHSKQYDREIIMAAAAALKAAE
jgi:hypothetical protein